MVALAYIGSMTHAPLPPHPFIAHPIHVRVLILAGLITLIDPPRHEVPTAVAACHTAGIKVVMVTGDHPVTATSIARKIGLVTKPTRDLLAAQRNIPKEQVQSRRKEAM